MITAEQAKNYLDTMNERNKVYTEDVIFIDNQGYTKLYSFTVLWAGWECDDKAYIVVDSEGNRHLAMSSHTAFRIVDISELYGKINEYNSVLSQSQYAIELLSGN